MVLSSCCPLLPAPMAFWTSCRLSRRSFRPAVIWDSDMTAYSPMPRRIQSALRCMSRESSCCCIWPRASRILVEA